MALVLAVVFVLDEAAEGRAALEQKAETIARSSATAIDRQLAAAEALLTGLTVSSALDTGDVAAFHAQAVEVAKPPGTWLLLLDRDGRQLANTLRPYGTLLPDLSEVNKRIVSAVVQDRRTSITDLSQSPITGETGIGLGIPVVRDRAVAYVLAIAIPGDRLTGILDPDGLPFGWSIALLDSAGNAIAQHPATEGPGDKDRERAGLSARIDRSPASGPMAMIDGYGRSFNAHGKSAAFGLTTLVTVPEAFIRAPNRRALLLTAVGGGLLLVLAVGLALVTGSRFDRPFLKSIAASEERFRVMAETVPSILFACDPDWRCEYVNQRFYDYTGMPPGAALGSGWMEVLHPVDKSALQTAARGEERPSRELRLRGKDGAYRWFLGHAHPVRDAAGRVVKWLGTATEIDDFKEVDAKLRSLNERLTAVLSSISECYCTVDCQWLITHVNPHAAELFGEDAARLVGRPLWHVVPQLVGRDAEALLRQALEEHRPVHLESASSYAPIRWLEINGYPWTDGLSIFLRDITRRKTAEAALRGTQQLLQSTMDALSARIAILDEHGVIIAVNTAWRRFADRIGVPATTDGNGIGCNYLTIVGARVAESPQAEQVTAGLCEVISGERADFRLAYSCRGAGEQIWFDLRAIPFSADGARRIVIAQEDITDMKRAETGLRDLAGRLLSVQDDERRNMARELHDTTAQNLVAALLDIDRLQQMNADDASRAILGELRGLVEQSLQETRTFSYLLHPPLFDIRGLAPTLSWYLRGFEKRSAITVSLSVQEGLQRMPPAVENALFRVVQEALTNIHRHSGSATAEIRLAQSSKEVVLEVTDHGRGISGNVEFGGGDIASLGVGISGMRVRLHQLAGDLKIRSTGQGTTIRASVSLEHLRSITGADDLSRQIPAA
jgi:PAS domain S-box-containing protein